MWSIVPLELLLNNVGCGSTIEFKPKKKKVKKEPIKKSVKKKKVKKARG